MLSYKSLLSNTCSINSRWKPNLWWLKILDKLQYTAVIDYLVEQLGISRESISDFTAALKATKFNKSGKEKASPSEFMKSKTYKENPEYAKIMKEVNDIVNNPNKVNIDYGFNA